MHDLERNKKGQYIGYMNKGTIVITLEGVSFEETERCRLIIHQLFEEGFFNLTSGSFTANFDEQGIMATTEKRIVRRRNKPIPTQRFLEQFRIETTPVEKSTIAFRT